MFIALSLAALAMVILESSLDLFLDRVADQQDRVNAANLEAAVDMITDRIFSGPPPMDEPQVLEEGRIRYTVRLGEAPAQPQLADQDDILLSRNSDRWLRTARSLGFARFVEVEMALGMREYLLANRLLLDIIDLPVFFLIAMVTALILTRLIARPVIRLTEATRGLAARRFGMPVHVPPGNDELSELAVSFNVMSREVQGFLERERAFSRYVSHELRTPLSALRLQVDSATMGHASAATVLPVLDRQIGRMEGIVESLLSLSRLSEPDPTPRPLQRIVDDLLNTVPAASRERMLVTDRTPPDVMVTHGPLLLRAMGNLVDNALTHGSGDVALTLSIRDERLEASVVDEGPGVPEAELHRLTEPFVRLGPEESGLGLGLSLVSLIARSLDGTVRLRNTGTGMAAVLVLPIVVIEP